MGADVRGVDLAEVERLLAFMQQHGLDEFEYERAGVHIRLKRASAHSGSSAAAPDIPRAPLPASGARSASSAAAAREHAVEPSALPGHEALTAEPDLHVIKSPIVGTYYSAASPTAEPFVAVGAKVEPGQVLCIIEAMKLMNEIESDVAGEIVRIFVENGKPVEYGEPLFGVRPRGKK